MEVTAGDKSASGACEGEEGKGALMLRGAVGCMQKEKGREHGCLEALWGA